MRNILALLVLVLVLGLSSGETYFNTPNEGCSLKVTKDCPVLCVRQYSDCPAKVKPQTCDTGYVLCPDLSCHEGTDATTACAGVSNPCMCESFTEYQRPADDVFYPCSSTEVTIQPFNTSDPSQVFDECAKLYNVPSDAILTSSRASANETELMLSCTAVPIEYFNGTELGFLIFYAYFGFQILSFVCYYAYKKFLERNMPAHPKKTVALGTVQYGYRFDLFGTFNKYLLILTSAGWLGLLVFIDMDYYSLVNGKDEQQVFWNTPNQMTWFIVIWHVTLVWLGVLKFKSNHLVSFFRIEVPLSRATYVEFWTPEETEVFLADADIWSRIIQKVECWFHENIECPGAYEMCPVSSTELGARYVHFRCLRYVYDEKAAIFDTQSVDLGYSASDVYERNINGLTTEEAVNRLELVGDNSIHIEVPSLPKAMMMEFFGYFYIYQVMLLIIWYYFAYWKLGIAQTILITTSGMVKVVIGLIAQKRIQKMTKVNQFCKVRRNGVWESVHAEKIVPGDVLSITDPSVVPCGAVLLKGSVIVDESMLTGESMPVHKQALDNTSSQVVNVDGKHKKNYIFAGTEVKQINVEEGDNEGAIALVYATAGSTFKGKLIRSILFPSAVSFIFNTHLLFVFAILIVWAFCALGICVWLRGSGEVSAWFYGMFCLSQILSPLLPAMLVIGQSMAAARLRGQNIFCINFERIVMAGKTQRFCFDKTGTLTRQGLEFVGLRPIHSAADFTERVNHVKDAPHNLKVALSTCHSVSLLGDRAIGNPVDVEMFASTQSVLSGAHHETVTLPSGEKLTVLKRFDFDHGKQLMSVVVREESNGEHHVFVKGSFEKVKGISNEKSLPSTFDAVSASYARDGHYTLCLAHKSLGCDVTEEQLDQMHRETCENEVNAIGLLLFHNKLKDDTCEAMATLKEGSVRPIMVTGDNALTGMYIARECGMVEKNSIVRFGDLDANGKLVWEDFAAGDEKAKKTDKKSDEMEIFSPLAMSAAPKVELAVTGKVFNAMIEDGSIEEYLDDIRVFARMTPDDKVNCVKLQMNRGVTAMCGDGGNDCGALRAAHAGIAFSSAEASIVSPFSTKETGVNNCVLLLREGRAALATSFACYKYLLMYGESCVFLKMMMYYFSAISAEWIWILMDGFLVPIMSLALTLAKPHKKLASVRPTARLLGYETFLAVVGQVFINLWFGIGCIIFLYAQDWFSCMQFDGSVIDGAKWWLLGDNYEAEVIAVVLISQIVNAAGYSSFGGEFRAPFYRNYFLCICYVAGMALVSVFVLADPNPVSCWFRINCGDPDVLVGLGYPRPYWYIEPYNNPNGHNVMPMEFRWKLYLILLANVAAGILYHAVGILGPVRKAILRYIAAKQASRTSRNVGKQSVQGKKVVDCQSPDDLVV